jgi:hypothetical protein
MATTQSSDGGVVGVVWRSSATGGEYVVGVTASGTTLTVKDEGGALATAADTLDFVGAGVTASGTTGTKTITIPGTTLTGIRGAATTTDVFSSGVTGDAGDRFVIDADGTFHWGDGSGVPTTPSFNRVTASFVKFNATHLQVEYNVVARTSGGAQVEIGDAGPGGAASVVLGTGVSIYRGGTDILKTDDALYLNNGALVGGTGGGQVFFGSGAPNNSNGTNGDLYFRVDGGALTTIYQRRAGTWTGIV